MEEVLLQLEKVYLDIQVEPRGPENGPAEYGLILTLIYMALPKGELLLMGVSSCSKSW